MHTCIFGLQKESWIQVSINTKLSLAFLVRTGVKPRALHRLDRESSTKLHPSPCSQYILLFFYKLGKFVFR